MTFFFKADLEVSLHRILDNRPELKFFEAGMDESARVRADLETDLRNALANETMDVYFQPLVNTRISAPRLATASESQNHARSAPSPENGPRSPVRQAISVASAMMT